MNRHFLVPASIAAALHAGLLFGIRPTKSDETSAEAARPPVIEFIKNVIEFTLEPPPTEVATAVKQGSPEEAPPVLPEPPAILCDGFVIKAPDTPTHVNVVPVARLPLGPEGLPTGLPEGPAIGIGDILGSGALDQTPRTRSQTPPIYPFEAKRNGQSGTVTVEFIVNESGHVLSARVTDSTDPVFNDSALRAVARWRFEPGRKDGRVVRFRMAVPVVFSLSAE